MSSKRSNGDKSKKYGFYIALGVCLVAVGIAAWSTYDAVDGYVVEDQSVESVEDAGASAVSTPQPTVSPAESKANEEDGEALKRQETQSEVSANENAEETTNEVESADAPPVEEDATETAGTPEEETPAEETYAEQDSTDGVQANAGILYEISSIMVYPVGSTEVLTAYSNGMPVYSSTMKDWRVHTGTDFKAESGEAVQACANGRVIEVNQDIMLGNTLVVEHGDYVFYYCGLGENIELAEGDIVSAGQVIGTISSVPFEATDEAHLHLEVKQDNVYLNPEDVLAEYQK